MSGSVVFFTMWPEVPVYHEGQNNHEVKSESPDGWTHIEWRTPCGRATSTWDARIRPAGLGSYEWRNERESGTYVPERHAVRFARPCAVCFPEASE